MIKVVLADDESRVLKTLQSSIPWIRLGLEVAGMASNGTQALDLMTETGADILITDIRMPGMDGLALCEALRECHPGAQIILISGYADFAYAQSAIRLNVLGYCLKPVNMAELQSLLKSAVKNIRHESNLQTDDLLDCIEEGVEENIRQRLLSYGLTAPRLYLASSINLPGAGEGLHAELSIRLGKHKYIYLSATPFNRQTACELVFRSKDKKSGMGLYPLAVSPVQLKEAITECIIMAYQFFITGSPSLCEHPVEGPMTEELLTRLKEALGDSVSLRALLSSLRDSNLSLMFNVNTAYRFLYQIYSSRLMESLDAEERLWSGYEQLAFEYENFGAVLTEIENHLDTVPIQEKPAAAQSSSFMQIIKYLNENYNQELSLKKLSEEFHLNSSYVSYLIKNETGLTYSQYLTELRIGKARSLLETTDLSLAEISESVGFHDYFYFIKKFKKMVGVTPGHYMS